jgi:hypothetical protein
LEASKSKQIIQDYCTCPCACQWYGTVSGATRTVNGSDRDYTEIVSRSALTVLVAALLTLATPGSAVWPEILHKFGTHPDELEQGAFGIFHLLQTRPGNLCV